MLNCFIGLLILWIHNTDRKLGHFNVHFCPPEGPTESPIIKLYFHLLIFYHRNGLKLGNKICKEFLSPC